MKIYISASWKNRAMVRQLATVLRDAGHEVYDFTDPRCRRTPELPPEKFPEQFDPDKHNYRNYLESQPAFRSAVEENRRAIEWCDLVILLIPCGIDATADWALGVGLGKQSVIVGHPPAGERSPTHLWADALLDNEAEILPWIDKLEKMRAGEASKDKEKHRELPQVDVYKWCDNNILESAEKDGFRREQINRTLDGFSKLTKSSRVMRLVRMAYWRGCRRGVDMVRQANIPVYPAENSKK